MQVNDYNIKQHPFLRNNRSNVYEFDNPTGSEYTLEQGQVVARDASTGKLVVFESTNTQPGGKLPVGIVGQDRTMAGNATGVRVTVVTTGDVLESKLKLAGSDTLETQVTVQDGSSGNTEYARKVRDLIEFQTGGIQLVAADQLTEYDND